MSISTSTIYHTSFCKSVHDKQGDRYVERTIYNIGNKKKKKKKKPQHSQTEKERECRDKAGSAFFYYLIMPTVNGVFLFLARA